MMKQVDNSLLIPVPDRSNHNLDSEVITSANFGTLIPFFCMETVPGGNYTINAEALARFQPIVSPLMHKCDMKVMYFYVPNRILWDGWEEYITGKVDKVTSNPRSQPYFTREFIGVDNDTQLVTPKMASYFGYKPVVNPVVQADFRFNALPFFAYQKIYNRYFRHKAIEDEVIDSASDGQVDFATFSQISTLRTITHEDDYFNSALPSPQQGEPIFVDDVSTINMNASGGGRTTLTGSNGSPSIKKELAPPNEALVPNDLYTTIQINLEEIRRAAALQKFVEVERNSQSYIDYLKANFNVNFPDGRAQEPIYITGSSQPVVVSDVVNTADVNQGKIVGTAAGYSKGQKGNIYVHEHGLIMGICVFTYKPKYLYALPKLHTKTQRFDFFNPIFDGIGEQAIKRVELSNNTENPENTFGYVPRHFEYRSSFDMVTGEMATLYRQWHLARNIGFEPVLNIDFFKVIDERRIFAFQQQKFDPIMVQIYNNVRANLPMGKLPETIL